jgi:hypothetical protein
MSDNSILIDIQATDNASSVISGVSNTLVASFKNVDAASAGLASSVNSAIAPLSQVEQAQLGSADASIHLQDAQTQLSSKQANLSNAVRQYGVDSEQATVALRDFNSAQSQVASLTPQITSAIEQQSINYKDLAISVSGVATASFGLYMAYDSVEKASVQVDRANILVKSSTNTAEKAQTAYNEAVAKYGANSAEAVQKATDLGIANDRAALATERAQMSEDNYSNSMTRGALMVIPSVITLTAGLSSAVKTLSDSEGIGAVAETALSWAKMLAVAPTATLTAGMIGLDAAMDANPVAVVVLAIAALVAIFIAAYTYIAPFRDAVNSVGSAIMNALKPAIDVIVGGLTWLWNNVLVPLGNFLLEVFIKNLEAVAAAIKWVSDGIGAIAGWIGDSWAKLTGTFKDSVAQGMADQLAVVEKGLADQTAEVNKKYDEMVSTVETAYTDETNAALASWNSRLTQEVTGWDKVLKTANEQSDALVDAVTSGLKDTESSINDGYDSQLKSQQSAYSDQLAGINSFYDDVIATTQDKLNAIKNARSTDLDNLELNYLLQKQAMEGTLNSYGSTLTVEQKQSVLSALEKTYNDKRSDISDNYRIQELEAEKTNDANIEQANKDRAAALLAAGNTEIAAELALLNSKNSQLAAAEVVANGKIAQINRDRNATLKEIMNDRDTIESQHTAELKLIAQNREDDLTAIARTAALERELIAKNSNALIAGYNGTVTITSPGAAPLTVPSSPATSPLPPEPGSANAPGGVNSPWQPSTTPAPAGTFFPIATALSQMLSAYPSASGPQNLADKLALITMQNGGKYNDATTLALMLSQSKGWSSAQLSAFDALIPRFAEGGTVDSPMLALIGEAGPERVTPLSKFSESSQSNQTNTIYVNINIGDISAEVDLDDVKKAVIGGVVIGVGRRS